MRLRYDGVDDAIDLVDTDDAAHRGGSHRGNGAHGDCLGLAAHGDGQIHVGICPPLGGCGVDKCQDVLLVTIVIDFLVTNEPSVDARDGAEGFAARVGCLRFDVHEGALDAPFIGADECGSVFARDGTRNRDERRADDAARLIDARNGAHALGSIEHAEVAAFSGDGHFDGVCHRAAYLAVVLTRDTARVLTHDGAESVPTECLGVFDGDDGGLYLAVVDTRDGACRAARLQVAVQRDVHARYRAVVDVGQYAPCHVARSHGRIARTHVDKEVLDAGGMPRIPFRAKHAHEGMQGGRGAHRYGISVAVDTADEGLLRHADGCRRILVDGEIVVDIVLHVQSVIARDIFSYRNIILL